MTRGDRPTGETQGSTMRDTVRGHERITAAFVLEQTLGHITHTKNLRALVRDDDGFHPVFVPVPYDLGRHAVPGWSNWTIRAGVRANRALFAMRATAPRARPDVLFVHTQVPAVLLQRWMRRIPTVVSLDATPLQYDSLGEFYSHRTGPAWVERAKHRVNRACFDRARHIVTWSEWAKRGVVDEYGIEQAKITAIAPGVDLDRWSSPGSRDAPDGPVRILFVGGDLRRKGGDLLIAAARQLRAEPDLPEIEVHLVTGSEVGIEPGIVVHRGLTANSPELIGRYHEADIFCLPTLGDCLPMVLAEAAAAALPMVSTDVGAIHEVVRPGVTGELVPPGNGDALTAALRRLVIDVDLRRRLGAGARRLAERDHDARKNADRIVGLLERIADA